MGRSGEDKEACDHWIYNKKQEIKRNRIRVDNFVLKCQNRFTALEKLSGGEEDIDKRKYEKKMATTRIHINVKEINKKNKQKTKKKVWTTQNKERL